jgi:hypothetical protein
MGFAWSNMFVTPEDDPRTDGGFVGERATLLGYLADQRLTLELKCADLDAAQLAERSVPPSKMSLLGLVRHMTDTERAWIRLRMATATDHLLYRRPDYRDVDFDGALPDPAVVEEALINWREEMAYTDSYVSAVDDLGYVGPEGDALREVLIHLIEEYARHNGHADLLRECIDGRIGQ